LPVVATPCRAGDVMPFVVTEESICAIGVDVIIALLSSLVGDKFYFDEFCMLEAFAFSPLFGLIFLNLGAAIIGDGSKVMGVDKLYWI